MRHVLLGKRLLFPVVALLSVNCGKTLVVQLPSAVSGPPAGKSSIGNPEIVLFEVEPSVVERGQEAVLRWKVNNAETIEINPGGDAISPMGTRIVRPNASTSYLLTAKRKEVIQSVAVTVNVISPLLISASDRNRSISRHELAQQPELADVYFGFDGGDLPADAGAILKRDAEIWTATLKASPDVRIHLEGHCDDRGSAEYSLGLGDRRAETILELLPGLGLQEQRLAAVSYGSEKPACAEETEQCWQQSRRVHFTLVQ